jgi:selenium metabolism protein YedF
MAKRFLILSDRVGSGDDDLGRILMRNFLYTLARADDTPAAVALMNGGVRLACEGSDSLDDLVLLVEKGVPVRACGTCLDYLGLAGALRVGEVGTMVASVDGLLGGEQVVTIA